jgi:hypothetical protein
MSVIKLITKNPETINGWGKEMQTGILNIGKRWEWYMSSRIGINGDFVNINQKVNRSKQALPAKSFFTFGR